MYAAYAQGRELRGLVAIVGEDALNERDKQLLDFSAIFEDRFCARAATRTVPSMRRLTPGTLSNIDTKYLVRLDEELIAKYHPENRA